MGFDDVVCYVHHRDDHEGFHWLLHNFVIMEAMLDFADEHTFPEVNMALMRSLFGSRKGRAFLVSIIQPQIDNGTITLPAGLDADDLVRMAGSAVMMQQMHRADVLDAQ